MSGALAVTKQPPSFMPVDVASRAGAANSGWWHSGNRPWSGQVLRARDGAYLAVDEVAAGWKVTDETGQLLGSGRDLEALLKKVLA